MQVAETPLLLTSLPQTSPPSPLLKSNSHADFRRRHHYQPCRKQPPWQRIGAQLNLNILFRLAPVLTWLPGYNVKENLIWDLIAGLTVSILMIPHGLAFAQLGGQVPVVGLYMAIFPIFVYGLLGTSRHISLGMQAIVVIMVGRVVDNHSSVDFERFHNSTEPIFSKLEVGIACTFMIGVWQVVLACLQLGSLCVFLSGSLISGLTSAAAVHVIFFQLKDIFGVPLTISTGPLKLIYATISLFQNMYKINCVTFAISLTVFIILFAFNNWVKPILAKRTRFPVPVEFLLISLSVVASWALDLGSSHYVRVVGSVPKGFPTLMVPPMQLIPNIAMDCLIIALVSLSINISIVKVFAKKGNYEIRENQEFFAYGAANIFGGFFQCLPVCTAISRSMILFSVGGKTELVHFICLTAVLFMLFFLGPFFELVPVCVLAAIVIVCMVPLLTQIGDFPKIWRLSKLDGIIWLSTFFVVIFVDLDYGIAIGLIVSIIIILVTTARARLVVLQSVEDSFVNRQLYATVNSSNNLIFQIIGGFNFVNCERVFQEAQKKCDEDWVRKSSALPQCVILDLSRSHYCDPAGITELIAFNNFVKSKDCLLVISGCSENIYNMMETCNFFNVFDKTLVMFDLQTANAYVRRVIK